MSWNIFNEDAIEWAKRNEGAGFHALFTDSPYHLESMVKRFGKKGSAPAKFGKDGSFSRIGKGFMGQTWDGGDIAFQKETWEAFKGVMLPGAFGMSFSASRNWHRLATAIEDAGFLIHPSVFFLWVNGQGLPKSTKVKDEQFSGYKYGASALKPAVEPVIVFQKPYEGKPLRNILETGAGVMNIDDARIPLADGEDGYVINRFTDGAKPFGNGAGHSYESVIEKSGRYPSNLILDEFSAEVLEEQRPDSSKFFYTVSNALDEVDPFLYWNKASVSEKNEGLDVNNPHPTVKPLGLCKYLSTLLLPPDNFKPRKVFVPFSGVGSEMIGALLAGWDEVVGIEFDTENGYVDIAEKRLKYWIEKGI